MPISTLSYLQNMRIAQRVMDDIIDLEAEKIENILDKINRDPEVEEVKVQSVICGRRLKQNTSRTQNRLGHNCRGDMLRQWDCDMVLKRQQIFQNRFTKASP